MLPCFRPMLLRQVANQLITAIDQPGRSRSSQLLIGRRPRTAPRNQSLEQTRELCFTIVLLIERTQVTEQHGFPELPNIRHVDEHEVLSLFERPMPNRTEQVRLA